MNSKEEVFKNTAALVSEAGFTIVQQDLEKPWGGFFVIEEAQAPQFAATYFPDENIDDLKITKKLSPKILMVAPQKRLSWQYHFRRAEIWKCIGGAVEVMTSETNEEKILHTLHKGDIIRLKQGERHRLIGRDDWGIVAEIWQHTDETHPSDEDDIVRVQDDFSRK
jgi:mannose-6-phosphate isomerase